jgi:protein-disulfide isomerase
MSTHSVLEPPTLVPAGAPAGGEGIAFGGGPVTVDAYIDFLCPFCRRFEEENGDALDELVDDGTIALVYHPLGFLDRLSTTRYSTRASAASGCASDGGRFRAYLSTLFEHQPPEGSAGLSDDELVALGVRSGLDQSFGKCVLAGAYIEWAEYVTARALMRGVRGTPTVYVDGLGVPANAPAIRAAAQARLR